MKQTVGAMIGMEVAVALHALPPDRVAPTLESLMNRSRAITNHPPA
ncbi:MAG: hypothetical protein HZA91_05730 [Verrucomicrobia bacterium]|nr:hypothetical protein [Verrucomicrobiota bacterium]